MATILIVDDVSANRRFLVLLLTSKGHRTVEAADGAEGLAAVLAEHPDLVITDVLMPVMDGYELVRHLRLDPTTSHIPVVFYTAHYGEPEARALALASGVSYVLIKPAESHDVLEIVERALSGATDTAVTSNEGRPPQGFGREHLRLLTDKLSEKTSDLRISNARLRAMINVGLELASEKNIDRLLDSVCLAARELFGASYVTLGILDLKDRTVQRFVTTAADAPRWVKRGDTITGLLETVVTERRTRRGTAGDAPGERHFPPLHPQFQAYLATPIASPSNVYGWICLIGNEGRSFTEDDEQLVVALSGQIGRIYENGYLYAVAAKRAEELEHEVHERKRAESALREERDRAQSYLDTAEVILLALDLQGRVTLINRKGCDLLGWTADELIGHDWIETCLPARIRNTLHGRLIDLVKGNNSVAVNPVLTRTGEERLIEWCNTSLRDREGEIVGTFSSGTDITEKHQAIEALRTAEERMRFALQSANMGIWDLDYRTGVLRWSETIEAHYGLKPGTFGGTFEAFVERVHPDDRKSVVERITKAMKSGSDFAVEHRTLWPDGTVRWLNGAGRIHLDEHGKPARGVGISLDVTERHMLEAQYRQAQKMEAIGQLAGGVAHDFNNLLTAILGYCELLRGESDSDDPRQEDISRIERAGVSAAALTHQLLAFSRKEIIDPKVLDLNAIVTDMRLMLGRLIEEDIKFVLGLREDVAPVLADRPQMEQVILNLVINARDAMPEGGTLTIETANVELDEHCESTHVFVKPGPYVALTVTDTGTGMSPQVQSRLFEPFFTTKPVGKGTGLGLATVHGIVARCGGCVNVYSEVGRGTSIKVYLPKAESVEMALEVTRAMSPTFGGSETVLVVEDAESLRELTRRLLKRQGYTVLVAANAADALRLSDEGSPIDVLLTDIVMPGGGGAALTKEMTARRPELKVIYMSGYSAEAVDNHGVLGSGFLFLHKPFTSEALARKIREVLD